MSHFPAANGVVVTLGAVFGNERIQTVIRLVADGALGMVGEAEALVGDIEVNFAPLWEAAFAVDAALIGVNVEPMTPGGLLPFRKNYSLTTFVGTIAGESSPQNVSILTAFYSTDNTQPFAKTRVAKTFWGPPPESKITRNTLDAAYRTGPLHDLANYFVAGIAPGTGKTFYRALNVTNNPLTQVYTCDVFASRGSPFTQRRRLTPIF